MHSAPYFCYTESVDNERQDVQNMSVVGHKVWLHMQDKGPYNKRAFARFLKRRGVLNTTHQSISGWLRKENPPAYFINAVIESLELSENEKNELYRLYFEGTGMRNVPEIPGLTEENASRIEAKKREWDEKDKDRVEGNSRDAGDRV